MANPSAVYGVIEISTPAKNSTLFSQVTPRVRLTGAGIDIIVDLYTNCHLKAEFDLSPDGNQLRVYHSPTGAQLYQAGIELQDGEPAIIIDPLTLDAVRLLHKLDFLSYILEE